MTNINDATFLCRFLSLFPLESIPSSLYFLCRLSSPPPWTLAWWWSTREWWCRRCSPGSAWGPCKWRGLLLLGRGFQRGSCWMSRTVGRREWGYRACSLKVVGEWGQRVGREFSWWWPCTAPGGGWSWGWGSRGRALRRREWWEPWWLRSGGM